MLVERQSERLLAQAHAPALKCRTSYLHYCQSLFALIRVNSWIVCCRIKTIHELTRIYTNLLQGKVETVRRGWNDHT